MCTFSRMRSFKTCLYSIKTKQRNKKYFGAWLVKGDATDVGRGSWLSLRQHSEENLAMPNTSFLICYQLFLLLFSYKSASGRMSNGTGRRNHVTHWFFCISFSFFPEPELRSGSFCVSGRATGTKERRCTPAEIKAAAARLTPHPPTLALGRWRWVICSLGFSQHTTSPTQHRLLQMLSFSHTGARKSLCPLLQVLFPRRNPRKKGSLSSSDGRFGDIRVLLL